MEWPVSLIDHYHWANTAGISPDFIFNQLPKPHSLSQKNTQKI